MESDTEPLKCNCCKNEENLNLEAYVIGDDLWRLCENCDDLKDWPNQPMKL